MRDRSPKCPSIDGTMEAPMGKTFPLFSTDPVTQRRLREAHAARNAYVRGLVGTMIRCCRDLLLRSRRDAAETGECGAVRVHAGIERRR